MPAPCTCKPWPFPGPLIVLQRRMNRTWVSESAWADPAEAHARAQNNCYGEQNLDWRIIQIPARGCLLNLIEGRIV